MPAFAIADSLRTYKRVCPTKLNDPPSAHWHPADLSVSGYSTSARHKPCGGIVGPDFERSHISKSLGISSGRSFPRPTSTRVPTIFLTIYRRKDFPRTV